MQVTQITAMIRGMATAIALAALPQAERLVSTFKGWVTENREWIRLNIGRFIESMGTTFERVWKAGKRLLDWIKDTLVPVGDFFQKINKGTDWSKLLTGTLVLLLAIFTPLIAKIALIAAGFALASAVVEEFLNFLDGKDSIIGRFLKDFEERFPALFELFKKMGIFLRIILLIFRFRLRMIRKQDGRFREQQIIRWKMRHWRFLPCAFCSSSIRQHFPVILLNSSFIQA